MASGFVTSAGKEWAGQYNCGGTDYAKPTGNGPKPTKTSKGGKK